MPPADAATHPGEAKVAIAGVSKRFNSRAGEVMALAGIDLTIAPGEFIALLGPSGCGKTTLLRILAGLETPSQGSVLFNGKPVNGPAWGTGFVFQSSVLLPWRTILSNVLLPVEILGKIDDESVERARGLLAATGLADFADHYPRELSGGMRQRAAICRTLLTEPELLLMDEPFGALDAMTRDAMNEDLYALWRSTGKTIVFVTHDIAEAVRLASRIVVMSPRPGHIERIIETGFGPQTSYADRLTARNFVGIAQELRALFLDRPRKDHGFQRVVQ